MKNACKELLNNMIDLQYKRVSLANISNIRRPGQKCYQLVMVSSQHQDAFSHLYDDINEAIDKFIFLKKRLSINTI